MRRPVLSSALLAVLASGCASVPAGVASRAGLDASAPRAVAAPLPGSDAASRALLAAGGGAPGSGYIGASVQGLFPSDSALSSGFAFDLSYTANVAERFSVELSLGRASYDALSADFSADFSALTLGAVAQVGMPYGAGRWYAGAGLAYWMNDLSGVGAVEIDDCLAAVVTAGTDLPINPNGDLCIELRYIVAEADLSTGGSLDLDAFGVRVNYVFKY